MAEDWFLRRIVRRCSFGHWAHGLDGQAVHLVGPGCREVGEVLASRICAVDMYLFHLIPPVGGLVDSGNGGRIYLWLVEGVSGFSSFGFSLFRRHWIFGADYTNSIRKKDGFYTPPRPLLDLPPHSLFRAPCSPNLSIA